MSLQPHIVPRWRVPRERDWERIYREKIWKASKATYSAVRKRRWEHGELLIPAIFYSGVLHWGLLSQGVHPIVAALAYTAIVPLYEAIATLAALRWAFTAAIDTAKEWWEVKGKARIAIPPIVDRRKLKELSQWWALLEERQRALKEESSRGGTWEWKGYTIERAPSTFESKVALHIKEGHESLLRLPYLPAGDRIYLLTVQGITVKPKEGEKKEELEGRRERRRMAIKKLLRKLKSLLHWIGEEMGREVWMISPEANFYSSPAHVGREGILPFSIYKNLFDEEREERVLIDGAATTVEGRYYISHFSAVMPFVEGGEKGKVFFSTHARPLKGKA